MKKEIVHFNSMCKKAAIGIMAFSLTLNPMTVLADSPEKQRALKK